jgi:uncharacterized protein (DUF58 family)
VTAGPTHPVHPTPRGQSYLDPQTLAAITSIDLRARMVAEGMMTGMHKSPYQGFSVEFAQHRQYAPGDDTRFLDWKVYGRSDKLYIKQYQKETNLDMLVMVDMSGSMSYGSIKAGGGQPWRKYDHAATLAAAMTYLATRQHDRAALSLFSDTVHRATRMSNREGHWRTIADALAGADIAGNVVTNSASDMTADHVGRTDLGKLFGTVLARVNRRSLLVLISDLFADPAAFERGLAQMYHRRHDVIVLQVLDPDELGLPFRSPTQFIGLEAEGRINLDPAALRRAYLDALNRHLDKIEQACRKYEYDYLLLNTSESLGPPLSHFIAHRAASVVHR